MANNARYEVTGKRILKPRFEVTGLRHDLDPATMPDGMFPDPVRSKAARIKNSYYYGLGLGITHRRAYALEPALNEAYWGEGTNSESAWKQTQEKILGVRRRKSVSQAISDAATNVTNQGATLISGTLRAMAELAPETEGNIARRYLIDPAFKWMANVPEHVDIDQMYVDVAKGISDDIKQYQKDHPELGLAIDRDAGYVEALRQVVTRPENLFQGLIESGPIIFEGILGTAVAGPAGGIAAMASGRFGEVYQTAREEGNEPWEAFGRASTTSVIEAAIEEFTLGKKIGLGKNFKRIMMEGGTQAVIWEGTKAFFRGTAEEGTQQINENFWRWLFTDRTQKWAEGVQQAAAMGGPLELIMSGAFAGAANIGTPLEVTEIKQRVGLMRKAIRQNKTLTEAQKDEQYVELDKAEQFFVAVGLKAKQFIQEEKGGVKVPDEGKPTVPTPEEGAVGGVEIKAGDVVDGLTVRGGPIPNTDSIAASLGEDYEETGVREIPFSEFTGAVGEATRYSAEGKRAVRELRSQIEQSGEITPLIVVQDKDGLYILEGATRADALADMGKTSFPALLVRDTSADTGVQVPAAPTAGVEEKAPEGHIPVYRGVDAKGMEGIKATEGGVHGSGVYFYTEPGPARSHATHPGGGVITGYVRPEDVEIHGNVAVLKDPAKFVRRGTIPLEETSDGGQKWAAKTQAALGVTPSAPTAGMGEKAPQAPSKAITPKEGVAVPEAPLTPGEIGQAISDITPPPMVEGGQPQEPKAEGLTRDEVRIVGTKLAKLMRAAQRAAKKVGFKKGSKEANQTAKEKVNAVIRKGKMQQSDRIVAIEIVKETVPKAEQWRFLRRIVTANTAKNIDNLMLDISKHLERADQKQAKREFQKFIKDTMSKFRGGKEALGQLRKADRDVILGALERYDLSKLSEAKAAELESRADYITRIASDVDALMDKWKTEMDAGDIEAQQNWVAMGSHRRDEIKRLRKTPVSEMSAESIRAMHSILKSIIDIHNQKVDSINRRQATRRIEDVHKSTTEIVPPKQDVMQTKGLLGAIKWALKPGSSNMSSLAGYVTGKTNDITKRVLFGAIKQGHKVRKALYQKFLMRYAELAEGVDFSDVADLENLHTVTLGGKQVEMSGDDILSVYALMQSTGGLDALVSTRGIRIETTRPMAKGLFDQRQTYEVGTPTLEELRDIAGMISDAHKKLVDAFFGTNKLIAEEVNKVSMKLLGHEIAIYPRHFHISRVVPKIVEGGKTDISKPPGEEGRFLHRTNSKAEIRIKPFQVEAIEQMQASAAYIGLEEALEDARTLVSNEQWQKKIRMSGGEVYLNEIARMLRNIQGLSTDQSIIETTAQSVLANAAKSILSARLSGMGVQMGSLMAARKFIDGQYLLAPVMPTKADIKKLMDDNPDLWLRWKGKQFDYAMGLIGAQKAFRSLIFDHTDASDKLLAPYTWGDQITIWKIWNAASNQVADKQGLQIGTDEHRAATLELFDNAMDTQPQWDTIHRTPITSHHSPFVRALSMFMSARSAQYNILLSAIDDFQKGRITQSEMANRFGDIAIASASVSVTRRAMRIAVKMTSVAVLASLGIIDKPEEEAKEELLRELMKIPAESVFNMAGLNVVGALVASSVRAAEREIKYGPMQFADVQSGNMLADVTLDAMHAISLMTQGMYHAASIPGADKRSEAMAAKKKALAAFWSVSDQMAVLTARGMGLPYEGPKADFVWPIRATLPKTKKKSSRTKGLKR